MNTSAKTVPYFFWYSNISVAITILGKRYYQWQCFGISAKWNKLDAISILTRTSHGSTHSRNKPHEIKSEKKCVFLYYLVHTMSKFWCDRKKCRHGKTFESNIWFAHGLLYCIPTSSANWDKQSVNVPEYILEQNKYSTIRSNSTSKESLKEVARHNNINTFYTKTTYSTH